jgi:hypothetical protein
MPNGGTNEPAEMPVGYVRVYQDEPPQTAAKP